jgi:hypothetical protein
MNLTRSVTLSVIYGLRNQLHWEGVPTIPEPTISATYVRVLTKDQVYGELETPSIIAYPSAQYEEELQIGGGFILSTGFTFDVYARTDGEMYNLVDITRHYVETTDMAKNYETGFPEYQVLDGKLRETYSGAVPQTIGMMYFSNVRVQYLDRVTLIGETRAHRAQVVAVIEVATS